ncbi:MAG: alpha amylase C-terminal domain-containing protein, partial [Actinomycetales bacterium]
HSTVQDLVKKLNAIYIQYRELWELDTKSSGFQWLSNNDSAGNILAYARIDNSGNALISVTNFSPVPQMSYQLPIDSIENSLKDQELFELLNTDSPEFGGSGVVNIGPISKTELAGQTALTVQLPPLGTLWLACRSNKEGN